jgi:hypothetical protein
MIISLARALMSKQITAKTLVESGLQGMVEDYVYIISNRHVLYPTTTVTDAQVYEMGKHLSGTVVDIALALTGAGAGALAGKVAKMLEKTGGVGKKLVKAFKSGKVDDVLDSAADEGAILAKEAADVPDVSMGICFTGETLVKTDDGHKQIRDIKVGDKVYSEDVETGEKGYKTVKQIFINDASELLHISVKDTEIKTTFPHPFYVVGKGWVEAKDLKVGDILKLANGETTEVKALKVEELDTPMKVYNFEVEDWHTYYVSGYDVLVHNTGSNPCAQETGKVIKTAKGVLKDAMLPTEGKIRFIPPEKWTPSQPLPKQNGGFVDKFGNVWTKGPSRTPGQAFEWDVQLSKTGKSQLGWASRDGSHLNVSLDGKITHK